MTIKGEYEYEKGVKEYVILGEKQNEFTAQMEKQYGYGPPVTKTVIETKTLYEQTIDTLIVTDVIAVINGIA